MIWNWLMDWVANLVEWLGAQLAAMVPPPPGWLLSLPAQIQGVTVYVAQAGHWFPVGLLAPVLVVVVACWIAGIAIKVVRIVASFATLGGGGAG